MIAGEEMEIITEILNMLRRDDRLVDQKDGVLGRLDLFGTPLTTTF